MGHAAWLKRWAATKSSMVDPLILLLFLISGAATGWLGVDLLPEPL